MKEIDSNRRIIIVNKIKITDIFKIFKIFQKIFFKIIQ